MKTETHFLSYLAHFFVERKMFQTKVLEKIKTHFVINKLSSFFSLENHAAYEIMCKMYCREGQAADDNTTHAHCISDA